MLNEIDVSDVHLENVEFAYVRLEVLNRGTLRKDVHRANVSFILVTFVVSNSGTLSSDEHLRNA